MTSSFKDIEKLESDLWEAADNLRANSELTSSDYFMPVLGVIFLRHAASRFDAAKRQIEVDQASGKMPRRRLLPADYIARPNGAGKTTFAREFLPNEAGCPVFVNADLIAAGLSPFRPEEVAFRAGRLMLAEIARHAAGLRHFREIYRHRVDFWQLFDNGGETPQLLEEGAHP
jgi:hypothetical protein